MLRLDPIGVVRSPHRELLDAPRQPYAARGVPGRIELVTGRHLEDAIADLDRWEYLWVIFWFDRAAHYRPKVLPPRSAGARRGVLATRSPHRPNPIGLSVVRLVAVRGLTLDIEDVDMVDGTPVLDIKPYVPWADIVATESTGWLEPLAEPSTDAPNATVLADPEPGFVVRWSPLAEEQLRFLEPLGHGALRRQVEQRLALGPQPHAYRRIRIVGDARELAVKAWRARFVVEERTLVVLRLRTGYRPRELALNEEPALDAHRAFVARFG